MPLRAAHPRNRTAPRPPIIRIYRGDPVLFTATAREPFIAVHTGTLVSQCKRHNNVVQQTLDLLGSIRWIADLC